MRAAIHRCACICITFQPAPPPHPCSNYFNAKAIREQQERYREYAQEQQRKAADPFYGTPLEGVFSGGRKGGSKGGSGGQRKYASEDVIDVSIDHIDD